jgi:hypothetical protein
MTKFVRKETQSTKEALRTFDDLQVLRNRGQIFNNFQSDIDLITRACGQIRNAVMTEIELIVCPTGKRTYREFSATTYLMHNDLSAFPQSDVDDYFAKIAAQPLAEFVKLAQDRGFRARPIAYNAEDVKHFRSPYRLSAFEDERTRIIIVQHETNARIVKPGGSPLVVKVSLFTPTEGNH